MSFLCELERSTPWQRAIHDVQCRPSLQTLASYVVEDVLPRNTRIVLLLESPHTKEVCDRYPLAGDSGVDVTRSLRELLELDDGRPFGRIIHGARNNEDGRLSQIGIMNVSPMPLQSGAYCDVPGVFKKLLFEHFERIRDDPYRRYRKCPVATEIDRLLVAGLKSRFDQLPPETVFIPCGHVAEAFQLKATTTFVPHPSNGQWLRPRHQTAITWVKTRIRELTSTSTRLIEPRN